MEYLHINGLKPSSIVTHLAYVKRMFTRYGLNVEIFTSNNVLFMNKALSVTVNYNPTVHNVFNIDVLFNIVYNCRMLKFPLMYKAIFLLAFFGFFRISNLVPRTSVMFDASRHLCRGDILVSNPGLQVIIKWSKTLQSRHSYNTIPIGKLANSVMCPVQAVLSYVHETPALPNDPMFIVYHNSRKVIIGEKHVRIALTTVLKAIGLDPKSYSFHTFRRSGATLAYQLGVPIEHIKSHGTWMSDAVWTYIKASSPTSPTSHAFQQFGFG